MVRSAWLAMASMLFVTASLSGATFLVDSNGTASDAAIDGNCLIAGGGCTLRAAIEEANATAALDVINFSGSMTIAESGLPAITQPVRIDGQASAVVIEGTPLTLGGTSDGSRILRLTIRNSPAGGVLVNTTGVTVAGNAISSNQLFGVRVTAANALIGGDGDGDGNTITGTVSGNGVDILAGPSSVIANTIETSTHGIYITAGSAEVRSNLVSGNTGTGILLIATSGVVVESNVVYANGQHGVSVENGSGNTFTANVIGTDSSSADRGNAGTGLRIVAPDAAASQNTVANNVIAFNRIGIEIGETSPADENRLTANRVFDNDESGVDLLRLDADPGPTLNDPGDGDNGANDFQNFPEINCISSDGASTTFNGSLSSRPSTTYRIEIFSNAACQSSSGRTYLGFTDVTTDGTGMAAINTTLPAGLAVGTPITATATDPAGNTSEYSACGFVASGTLVIQAQYAAGEASGSATITVTRTAVPQPASVNYAVTSGTAAAGADFTAVNGTLAFAACETSKSFTVPILDDNIDEPDETATVTFSNATTATLLIQDDDPAPVVTMTPPAASMGENGGTATLTFTLDRPSSQPITVPLTYGGTAAAGDYSGAAASVVIPAMQTTATLTLTAVDDTTYEGNETVTVNAASQSSTITIVENDPVPTASINSVTAAEGSTASFTVTLSNPSTSTTTVNYTTADVTALAGSDYVGASGQVVFPPGVTTQTITITTSSDNIDEPDETFEVRLPSAAGTGTITDDDPAPTVAINNVSAQEGTVATFTVTLSNPSSGTITVDYATANGTALAGSDYAAASGQVVFAPGVTTRPIAVTTIGDTVFEGNETFEVRLPAATGTGTILDDEMQADVSIVKSGPPAVMAGSPFSYTLTVRNAGPDPATNVTVTDVLPPALTFDSATASQGSCSGTATVVCTLGTLALGQSATVTLTVRAAAGPPVTNTAAVSAAEYDPAPANGSSAATAAVIASNAPALSEWMLMLLAAMLAAVALSRL